MKRHISSRLVCAQLASLLLVALLPASAAADWFSERFEVHGFVTSKTYFRSPNMDLGDEIQLSSWRTELNLEMSFDVYEGRLAGDFFRIGAYSVVRPIYEPVFDLQDEVWGKDVEGGDLGTGPAFPDNEPFASDSANGVEFPGSGECVEGEFCYINSDTGSLFQETGLDLAAGLARFGDPDFVDDKLKVPAVTIDNTVFFGRVTAPVAPRGPRQERIGDPATGDTYESFLNNPFRFGFSQAVFALDPLPPPGETPLTFAQRATNALAGSLAMASAPLTMPLNAYAGALGDANSLEQSPFDINRNADELKWECGDNAHPWCFVREAYLEFEWGRTFARVGRQQIVWGKTDAFRLQDNIMPLDLGYHNVFPDLEERRIPQLALDVIHSFGDVGPLQDVSLEFVWVFDKFLPIQFGQCGEPYAFTVACQGRADVGGHTLLNLALAEVEEVPWTFENTEPGLRLEFRTPRPSIAWSLSAFWSHQDVPVARFHNFYSVDNPNPAAMLFLQGIGVGNIVHDLNGLLGGPAGDPWVSGFDPYAKQPNGTPTGSLALANQQLLTVFRRASQLPEPLGGCFDSMGQPLTGRALGDCMGANFGILALPWTASEAVIEYPRVLTLGASMDYQIPRVDTVLRVETALDFDRALQDTSDQDGVSDSNVLLAAVGLDRSTFIPFINPNRTAFLSFQTFVEHILDYEDGNGLADGMVNYDTSVISTFFMQNFWRNDSLILTNFVAFDWQARAWLTGPQLRWIVSQNLYFDVGVNLLWGTEREHNIFDLCPSGGLHEGFDPGDCTVFDPETWRPGQWQALYAGFQRKAEHPFWAKESFADKFMEDRDEIWVGVTWQW